MEEANSISEELDKLVKFEILMVAPQVLGQDRGRTEVRRVTFTEYDALFFGYVCRRRYTIRAET